MRTSSPLPATLLLGAALALGALLGASTLRPDVLWGVTLAYLAYESGLALLLSLAAWRGLRRWRARPPIPERLPSVAVLIAAYNERAAILETVRSVRANAGLPCELIIASDGSTDGMDALVIRELHLRREAPGIHRGGGITLLSLPKAGKGAALNAALAHARAEVVVTLDADTQLGPDALREMVAAFVEPEVQAAAGFVYVRNAAAGLLTSYQLTEYLKAFLWRVGLVELGVNLQVSGAFGALRTATLRELGGFDAGSLVEDYEIIYRLHDQLRLQGRRYRVVAVPGAAAFTEGPEGLTAFLNQRTRWFTGFLQTLWDYRRMVGSVRHGAIGLFMLPIKCVDALLPPWGLAALIFGLAPAAAGDPHAAQAWGLLLARWLLDAAMATVLLSWHDHALPQPSLPPLRMRLALAWTEGLGFSWLRQLAVLRAYVWFVRRTRRWEQPRWQPAPAPAEPIAERVESKVG